MKKKTSLTQRFISVASSSYFFWGVIALFVLQATWIALSGKYPMAFDEEFHLGIIRLYADHLLPFWSAHPSGADAFGAVARDPSYLFHYLMSFPYLLLQFGTDSQSAQVLALRFMNIGFFATALAVWRKVLLQSGASQAITHLSLLLLVLVPVVPLLAAQLNYDNLLMLLLACTMLFAVRTIRALNQCKVDVESTLLLIGFCMVAGIVKYAALPILIAVAGTVLWSVFRSKMGFRAIWGQFRLGWRRTTKLRQYLLIAFVIIAGILFTERYAVNMVRYHSPVPDCSKVLSVEQCKKWGPWGRNYRILNDPTINDTSVRKYANDWFNGMWLRSFFAVDGPANGYQSRVPLTVPGFSIVVLIVVSVLALIAKGRTVWRRYDASVLWLFVCVSFLYVSVLWLNGLQEFMKLGQGVAINGRYLVLVAPMAFVISALAVNELIGKRAAVKIVFTLAVLLSFVWGGGAATYVLRSNDAWYWHNSIIKSTNQSLRDVFGPVTPGYYNPTKFPWSN